MLGLQDIKDITKNIEANIVGLFIHNPNLYLEYNDLDINYLKNNIWKFYFTVGKKIAIKGVKIIDEIAIETFLLNNEKLLKTYNDYGGYSIIETLEIVSENVENIEAYINELKKWSTVYDFVKRLSFDEKHLNNIKNMSIEDIYKYYSAQMNDVFINVNDNVETSKLNEGLWDIVMEANEGLGRGLPINSKMLDEEVGGWIDGQIYLMGGLSGAGKTTISLEVIISSIWVTKLLW